MTYRYLKSTQRSSSQGFAKAAMKADLGLPCKQVPSQTSGVVGSASPATALAALDVTGVEVTSFSGQVTSVGSTRRSVRDRRSGVRLQFVSGAGSRRC